MSISRIYIPHNMPILRIYIPYIKDAPKHKTRINSNQGKKALLDYFGALCYNLQNLAICFIFYCELKNTSDALPGTGTGPALTGSLSDVSGLFSLKRH